MRSAYSSQRQELKQLQILDKPRVVTLVFVVLGALPSLPVIGKKVYARSGGVYDDNQCYPLPIA